MVGMPIPKDIFTEPENVDPDTLANLGPLRRLAGIWEGNKGTDLNPKMDGPEQRQYFERVEMQPIDPQTNGPQLFYGLRYHTHIGTREEDITFHDQIGYWLWEPETGLIIQTLAIPRGQVALARGQAEKHDMTLKVKAVRGQTNYGICSTDFLEQAFRTDSYTLDIDFAADGSWTYTSKTILMVKGRNDPFTHIDMGNLTKVGDADLNPWLRIVRGKAGGPL